MHSDYQNVIVRLWYTSEKIIFSLNFESFEFQVVRFYQLIKERTVLNLTFFKQLHKNLISVSFEGAIAYYKNYYKFIPYLIKNIFAVRLCICN